MVRRPERLEFASRKISAVSSAITASAPQPGDILESRNVHISGPKNHGGQRRDRILRFFLYSEIGQFSPHFGAISFLNYTVNLENRGENPLEKIQKSSGDGAPKLQISVPCRGRTCPEHSWRGCLDCSSLVPFCHSKCLLHAPFETVTVLVALQTQNRSVLATPFPNRNSSKSQF